MTQMWGLGLHPEHDAFSGAADPAPSEPNHGTGLGPGRGWDTTDFRAADTDFFYTRANFSYRIGTPGCPIK